MEQKWRSSLREPDRRLTERPLRHSMSREDARWGRPSEPNKLVRSFREDDRSFRSNIVISSTASSPGYHFKGASFADEIDPSNYTFSAALRGLQGSLSPDGFPLNSKWYDAERFICNPLSGEVPRECLSANTLSFRHRTRVTMSAPVVCPNPVPRHMTGKKWDKTTREEASQISSEESKSESRAMRDVGTQSTPTHEFSSGTGSPTFSTPSTAERSGKRYLEEEVSSSENTAVTVEEEKKEEERQVKHSNRLSWLFNNQRNKVNGCWLFFIKKRVSEKRKPIRKSFDWFII